MIGNLVFLATGSYMLGGFEINALLSVKGREDYVKAHAPTRWVNEVINVLAGSRARVLYIGNSFGAFLEGKPFYTQWYNPSLQRQLAAVANGQQFQDVLQSQGITHVVISNRMEKQSQSVERLLRLQGCLIFSLGDVNLYAVGQKNNWSELGARN
jgi:hypothetical protein